MPSPIIVGVGTGTAGESPTNRLFTYRILNAATGGDLGALQGVTNEPIFVSEINRGSNPLTLVLNHYPSELTFGQIIRVNYPNGQVAGRWKYEGIDGDLAASKRYVVSLIPLVAELTDADFNANYSTDTTQPGAVLGATTFDVPILAAIPRTLHLSAGTISNDGNNYSYVFNNARCADTLSQAITFGSTGWWWFCTHDGVVSLRNSSPFTHKWTEGREIISGLWKDDIHSLTNGQPVVGGQSPGSTIALTAFAVDTNGANPYSVPNIGRRTATSYADSSILDQASVNAVASSLLSYGERVSRKKTLKLTNYTLRRPQPGDACTLRLPSPDPTDITKGFTVQGPFLITKVTEYGATNCFDIEISADMVVPITVITPTLQADQAMQKLLQNPARSAISPDGTAGNIGSGVLGGSGGGPSYTQTPSAPAGLAATTGIDLVSQTNNAYAALSWSANAATDVVTRYDVRWRKSADADTAASYYQTTSGLNAVKVHGLIQGFTYVFQVRAWNDIGNASAWSAAFSFTTSADTTAPAVPTGLTAYRTPRGAAVSWNGNSEADLQGYLLQVAVAGGPFQAVNPSATLATSYDYVAPDGTAINSVLVFQLAAVDWTGNQSAWSTVSANALTSGVYFEELLAGEINAVGTIQGGRFQTSASGARAVMDNSGLRLYDGTNSDYGDGAGITANLKSTDGSAFFSGTVSASQIQGVAGGGAGSGPRMWIDLKDTSAGVGPYLAVSDGTSPNPRVEIGNLAVNGNSPAQYGMRANDTSGNPIFDSLGLIQAATVLASNSGTGANNLNVGTSPVQATWSNTTFSVSRTVTVWILLTGAAGAKTEGSPATTNGTFCGVGVAGVGNSPMTRTYVVATTGLVWAPVICSYVVSLAAGSYTAAIYGYCSSTASNASGNIGAIDPWDIHVFQLGS